MPKNPDPERPDPPEDRAPTFWQAIASVAAAFFGVQSSRNRRRDFTRGNPARFIAVAFAMTAVVVLLFWWGATVVIRGHEPPAPAVRPPVRPVAAVEVPPASPRTDRGADDIEARVAVCAACHGKQGRSTAEAYYPSIAGKPAEYLFQQLLNFRDGRREQREMERMLAFLSDDYLQEMASYFAAQPAVTFAPVVSASPEVLARGERIALHGLPEEGIPSCASCHGDTLGGAPPAIPALAGLKLEYLSAQLGAWRAGTRRARSPDCMQAIVQKLAPADMSAAAAWIATRVPTKSAKALPEPPMDCGALHAPGPAPAAPEPSALVEQGRYLVTAGDCIACHTAQGQPEFSGGRRMPTAYGDLWSSNLTPDRDTGLGEWTADEFYRALHEGRSRDGRYLYPVFPYTSYTRVTRADSDAMFAYLQSLPPVANAVAAPALRFPYSTQAALMAWRALYFREGEFEPDPARSAEWNRGAYLVEGLGHCAACHTQRNWLGGPRNDIAWSGGPIPMLGWDALPLASAEPLSDEAARQMTEVLKHGTSRVSVATGPMAEVVSRSLQHLAEEDIAAMVAYVRTLEYHEPLPVKAVRVPQAQIPAQRALGRKIYAAHCADCHGEDGQGRDHAYPALAGNPLVTAPSAANAMETVLYGGYGPSTGKVPRPYGMPPYAQALGDDEVAAVLTYIRSEWGNAASAVSAVEVGRH